MKRCDQCQTKFKFRAIVRRKFHTKYWRERCPDDRSNRAIDAAGHVRQNVELFNDPEAFFFCSTHCYREAIREFDRDTKKALSKPTAEERVLAAFEIAEDRLGQKESLKGLWEDLGR